MPDPKKLRADANALVAELLQRLGGEGVHELEVRRGPLRVRVSKDGAGPGSHQKFVPVADAQTAPAVAVAPAREYPTVNAPLTGIFYRSPSPQAPAFIQIGSQVAQGDVIGLIEAMKLFNEIRSTAGGKVRRIIVENGQLVRAHQPIIELE
ncbi:MAG TPA: acetyl-CoA carboxylase [Verrucomicrobiae bacterium]|jgi:acetyl-CoA carboxylase biotin carboxyl carrier protein|nr:acetyl-CoA carboxylase [Verrucomicrobiae bacterium]